MRAASTPLGVKDCVVQSYLGDKSKPIAIGRHCPIGTAQARRNAAITIARVKQHEDRRQRFQTYLCAPTVDDTHVIGYTNRLI